MNKKGDRMKGLSTLLMIVVAGTVSAQDVQQRTPGRLHDEAVAVTLVRWTTDADGAKRETGSADIALRVRERGSIHASTGFVRDDGAVLDPLCSNSIGGGGDHRELLDGSAHLWWVDVEVVEATTQRIELAIDWNRHDRDDAGNSRVAREGRRTIVLEEEQSHVIDFLEPDVDPEAAGRCGLNVLYELSASVIEDPKLADTRLQYFFWVFDYEDGNRQFHTVYASGTQGEQVEVEPVSLRWPIVRRTPDGKTADVVAEIRASLRGRKRVDGSIDLYLGARRKIGVARPGLAPRGGVGGGGHRMFNIRPGETIELVMPKPQGWSTERIDPAGKRGQVESEPDAEGIAVAENTVRVKFGSFFAERSMSIFVTATLLDDDEESVTGAVP
ncbi:MAG: hypothetical protein OEV00_01130 [Acidobacteriota bacterium]|nr:hypothetical protein [Acidobacteriota bacterium]MDH3783908.1 hypothetical protein [Acidobacteriota bacterium]